MTQELPSQEKKNKRGGLFVGDGGEKNPKWGSRREGVKGLGIQAAEGKGTAKGLCGSPKTFEQRERSKVGATFQKGGGKSYGMHRWSKSRWITKNKKTRKTGVPPKPVELPEGSPKGTRSACTFAVFLAEKKGGKRDS